MRNNKIPIKQQLSRTELRTTITMNKMSQIFCLVCFAISIAAQQVAYAEQSSNNAAGSGTSSMIMGTLMRYFDPSSLSLSVGEQPKMFANWSPSDESRKQLVLRDLISKASDLIENYQTNGLRNAPSLPINIPGFGAVMKTPDKLLRAELSMLQDLIKMAQKMTQNPLSATVDLPKGKQYINH